MPWIKARFRDDEVLARCTPSGELHPDGDFVPILYRPGGKQYKTRPDRLTVLSDASVLPDAEVAAQAPAPSKGKGKGSRSKSGAKKFSGGDYTSARSVHDAVQLWTDGACSGNPGPAGLGVVYLHGKDRKELSEYLGIGTNNVAELTAILRGLQLVEDTSKPIDVVTDSTYCIGLLTQGWKAKANKELVAELRELLATFDDVRMLKVPGHAGVPLNERADELAREAITAGS